VIRFRAIVTAFLWIAVVGGGILFPFYTVFQAAVKSSASSPDIFHLLVQPEILSMVSLTLGYSLSALAVAFVISLPLALMRSKKLEEGLKYAWVLPSFFYALIIIELFRQMRRVDPLFELYSMRTVWVAWVVVAIPFLTVSFARALRDLDPRETEMMQVMGATRIQRFFRYDLPKLSPMIRSSLLHQMWLYLTSFTLVVILGGGPPYETLEVGVYTSVRLDQLNYARAFAVSIWQLAILVALRFLLVRTSQTHLENKVGVEWMDHEVAPTKHFKHGFSRNKLAVFAVILLVCIRALLITSNLAEAFLTGVALSASVAIASMAYTLLVFYLRQAWLAELGAWMSPMVLSLAWWKAYAFTFPSLLLCIKIQVILLSPWIARVFFPVLARTRVGELEAIRTLGAHPLRAWWKVEWPRIRSQVYWMMALVFGLSLSEVSTVILFSRGDFEPLSVWIQNQLSRFQFNSAFEGTLLLVGISMLTLMSAKRR
jgi:thiamine transport system permease protein